MSAAAPSFAGFSREAFAWFTGLEADNSRAWFAAHRGTYEEAVRGPLEALLEDLADEHGGQVKLFRQQRDTRFSPDKSPYKPRTYGVIFPGSGSDAGLYAELSREGLFAGTGYYELAADQLARFREAVAAEPAGPALEAAVDGVRKAGLKLFGEALRTAPRGVVRDHPRVGLLRHKMLVAGRRLAPGPDGIPATRGGRPPAGDVGGVRRDDGVARRPRRPERDPPGGALRPRPAPALSGVDPPRGPDDGRQAPPPGPGRSAGRGRRMAWPTRARAPHPCPREPPPPRPPPPPRHTGRPAGRWTAAFA